jgi:hypothetical protein|tara:strand:+ start:584 stop:3031 length:2448 start_codon:yes stop_codon:yes gene_type:complete
MPQITVFRNIQETDTPFYREVSVVLDRIRDGANSNGEPIPTKEIIKKVRAEKRKTERNELKKMLPAVCFSGTFTKRQDASITEHSGLICLDFDGYDKQKDLISDKKSLSESKYSYAVFISPSGQGLKVLVKVPADIDNHKNFFNSLHKHYNNPHFDTTSKNISRVCYESHDPLIHINEGSVLWDRIEEIEYTPIHKHKDVATIPITDENKVIERLVKWWEKKYPMVEGQRNHNTYILAAAFNDFGISRSLAEYVLGRYGSESFTPNEIKNTIDSAYSRSENYNTKYYEDEDRLNQVKAKLRRGVPKKEIRSQLEDLPIEGGVIDSVIDAIEEEQASQTFWEKRGEKGTIKIVHILFKNFLEENGFYKYCPEGSKNYVFVRVTNNLIDHTSEKEIKDFILNYLLELDDVAVYNYFAENTKYFREEFLTLLCSIDVLFIADTKDKAYLYYRNCAVRISGKDVKPIDYLDLGGYVWKDHVIDRNFIICDIKGCDYTVFISNICNGNQGRITSMESTIGYMMHGYKNLSYCPAVILNDEVISDNPEGGTGKGIFMNALSQMKKMVVIDGKSFAFERSFAYQLVSADTQILCFDDVKKHFEFERLFSVVTEGLTLEKKNKDAIKIPFDKSPKVAITTNYTIRGRGNSFERRKWELELHQFYTKTFTPQDEFNKLMFSDWDDDEWCQFDNYMVSCLQMYINKGLVVGPMVNKKKNTLGADTSHQFLEWCGLIVNSERNQYLEVGVKVYKNFLYEEFIRDYPDYARGNGTTNTLSRIEFYRWLNFYSEYKTGVKPEEGRDSRGNWMRMRFSHELEVNTKMDF